MEEDSDNNNSTSVSDKKAEFKPRGGIPDDFPPTRGVLKSPPKFFVGAFFQARVQLSWITAMMTYLME
jgi:hypothetical protein